jgi:hypothetical protein
MHQEQSKHIIVNKYTLLPSRFGTVDVVLLLAPLLSILMVDSSSSSFCLSIHALNQFEDFEIAYSP